ncbi:Heterotrimeric G-protein alpha subunit 4 [Mycena kentingensis (nom. inval.)]|nr:Heterotrimeric G-protein alpha subunit 4 [Mycena kentingensis (nom. inval.)]
MGICMSSDAVSDTDRKLHEEAEKALKEAKAHLALQSKVLLLGSGDSGKSTVLKQMRLIYNLPFSSSETEHFRLLIFDNLVTGLKLILDALPDMGLELDAEQGYTRVYPADDPSGRAGYVRGWAPGECGGTVASATFRQRLASEPDTSSSRGARDAGVLPDALMYDVSLIELAPDLKGGIDFPLEYLGAILRLWEEPVICQAWARANEAALPENLPYLISALPRLFTPGFLPTPQDIVHTRARTVGITETTFKLAAAQIQGAERNREVLMVDVGGQKSERRKWIHCFQDVTSILFLVSLSGYDQVMVEDKSANQMQDAMTIFDSIVHSVWFKQTSIIVFLNKNDLYEKKIKTSHIRTYFPEYDGEKADAKAGRDYFRKRFKRLGVKAGRAKEREIYVYTTNATDTAMLTAVMRAVVDIVLRSNLSGAAFI